MRFDVFDVGMSVGWYTNVLDMEFNEESSALPYYGQVFYPEYPNTQIGLNKGEPYSGTATATIVVNDIVGARDSILNKGWYVGEICASSASTPEIVLAFFCDPNDNNLALRQDDFMPKILLPECGAPQCSNRWY
ncbi:MAG: hypothetical protein F6K41_44185 [Symploca sp. SIO3E6]|nr:hypothetical protein [Caldora sp. SIO3E6]